MGKESKDYAALVGQAEKAVAEVKDPELRRIAYEKVLDRLLSEDENPLPSQTGAVAGGAVKVGRRRKAAAHPLKQQAKRAGGPATYLSELVEEGFFRKPTTIAQVKAELENRGHHIPLTSLSGPLQRKCQDRVLRRQKIKAEGKKETFAYSNW